MRSWKPTSKTNGDLEAEIKDGTVVVTQMNNDGEWEEVARVKLSPRLKEEKWNEILERIGATLDLAPDMRRWHILRSEQSWGSKGSFGLFIAAFDSDRDLGQKADWADEKRHELSMQSKATYEAARILTQGIRGQTEITRPDYEERRQKEKKYFEEIFAAAEISPIRMDFLPNGYCKEFCCLAIPWFNVTCSFGVIEIGWRKRVINIDWSKSDVKKKGSELFSDVEDTVGDDFIHAWKKEQAVDYLKRLKAAAEGK